MSPVQRIALELIGRLESGDIEDDDHFDDALTGAVGDCFIGRTDDYTVEMMTLLGQVRAEMMEHGVEV